LFPFLLRPNSSRTFKTSEAPASFAIDLNAQTGRGETAMSIAKEAGASEVLKVLEEFGRKRKGNK
jgi:ankyrin repeat protein